jgi:4-amino-4-deoxy-L-arabinose transferase-like glycosyltransferase
MRPRSFTRSLAAVAVLGLAVRLAYIFFERAGTHLNAAPGVVGGDAFFYQKGAWLLPHHGFISPEIFLKTGQVVQSAEHPPLYLLWLGLLSFVHIVSPLADMVWSAVLGTGTVVLIGLLAREIAGEKAGLIAAGLAAIYPNVWALDGFLQSETMALFTVTLALWLAYRYWHEPSTGRAIAMGVGAALATLSRAELILLFPFVVLPLIVMTKGTLRSHRVKLLAVAAIAGVLPIAPWVIFNMVRFDKPVYLSTGFGITLSSANCDETYYGPFTGYWNKACADRVRANDITPDMDQSEQDPVFRDKALDYIGEHQSRLPYVVAARWGRISGSWNAWQQAHLEVFVEAREKWVSYSALVSWWVLLPLAFAGAFVVRAKRVPVFPLLAAPVTVLMAITLTFATNRYRATTEGVLCVLAGITIAAVWDALTARRPARDVDLTEPHRATPAVPAPTA